jgi:hypothetical protein
MTSHPGIICILCHQVLCDPSEHGTSSMGKHTQANVYIAMLNKLTSSEVTQLTSWTVDDTTLAILKRQRSWGIPIVSSQRKFIFEILIVLYWLNWQTRRSKLAAKDFDTAEFHQGTWNRHLTFRHVSAHIAGMQWHISRYNRSTMRYAAHGCYHPPPCWGTFAGVNTNWRWM